VPHLVIDIALNFLKFTNVNLAIGLLETVVLQRK